MGKLKQLGKDFKEFITRGNVVDMAVAVIIGAAFNAIVTALTNNIIKPFINWIIWLCTGGNEIGLITMLNPVYVTSPNPDFGVVEGVTEATVKTIDLANSIYIDWGLFIMKIIDFLLIALVLFVIVKAFMGLKNMRDGFTNKEMKEMNKAAKERAKSKGITKKEALAEITAEKEAEKAAAEAEAAAKAAEEAAANPTSEQLLKEIRDLLAAQQPKKAVKDTAEKETKAE